MRDEKKGLKRREFLKGALVGTGAVMATGLGIHDAEARV